jgi:hypothetical protein
MDWNRAFLELSRNKFFSISIALFFLALGLRSYLIGNKFLFFVELGASIFIFTNSFSSAYSVVLSNEKRVRILLLFFLVCILVATLNLFLTVNFWVALPGFLSALLLIYLFGVKSV